MFHAYNQLSTASTHMYKLVELPADLLEYVQKNPGKTLQFKAPTTSNSLVLCTDSKTYNVRQMNHSNTVLLMDDVATGKKNLRHLVGEPDLPQLVGISQSSYQYELTETEGVVDTSGVLQYGNEPGSAKLGAKTVAEVCADSPIAPDQFLQQWHNLCGSEVDGKAVLLSPDFVTDALHTLVSVLIAEGADYKNCPVSESHFRAVEAQNAKYTSEIMTTIVGKFAAQRVLDISAVATWFGIQTLKAAADPVADKELLLRWKSSLPPFFSAPLDLLLLTGHYYRPHSGRVRYLLGNSLSQDIAARVKEMFQIAKEWDYDEFLPFVTAFIPPTKKPESVIMKFARKKRVGKKFVVCPR